jgi:hypothetical protein
MSVPCYNMLQHATTEYQVKLTQYMPISVSSLYFDVENWHGCDWDKISEVKQLWRQIKRPT